jgi:hypothetical protein
MRAELGLPSVKGDDEHGGGMTGGFGGSMGGAGAMGKAKRPINVKFEIPYFTTSGIQVRYLKITEPKVCSLLIYSSSLSSLTCALLAAIPLPPLGPLHYTIRRYCGPHAGRPIKQCAS